jgi:cytochrome P450
MGWQSVMPDFFQGGLVMRDYDEHRPHRGIMTSSFKPPAMRAVQLDVPDFLYHWGLEGRRFLKRFFMMDWIEKKRASNDEDVFAHFCRERQENGEHYADEDIVDHMVFLILAAHDTTTSASAMAAYHLCSDHGL